MQSELTQLKKEIDWLTEVDKFALQNSLRNLETVIKSHLTKERRFGFLSSKEVWIQAVHKPTSPTVILRLEKTI